MANQRQEFTTLTPQPSVGALPQRLTTDDIIVRGLIIESAKGNIGVIYIADTEAKATTSNRHTLYGEGDAMVIRGSMYADLNAEINLKDIWFHGDTPGDKLVVSYMDIRGGVDIGV